MYVKEIPIQNHVGVYGIAIKDDKILMIEKSRGPYVGMYDLPGGRIEQGEAIEDALHREFIEEVGCRLEKVSLLGEVEDSLKYLNLRDEEVLFHHFGNYYKVALSDGCKIKDTPDGHDSLGAKWINLRDVYSGKIQIPNIVKKVLSKHISNE